MRAFQKLLVLFLLSAPAYGQIKTVVTGTNVLPNGSGVSGTVIVSATQQFVTADNYTVAPGAKITVPISGNAFRAALLPNAGSTPSPSYYQAVFSLTSTSGQASWTEYWSVPATGPVDRNTIQEYPSLPFPQAAACVSVGCGLVGINENPDSVFGNFTGSIGNAFFGGSFTSCGSGYQFLNYYNHSFVCQPTGTQPRKATLSTDTILSTDFQNVVNETYQGATAISLACAGVSGSLGITPFSVTIVAAAGNTSTITPSVSCPIYLNGYSTPSYSYVTIPPSNRALFIADQYANAWDVYTTIGSIPPSFYTQVDYPIATPLTQREVIGISAGLQASDDPANASTDISINPNDTTLIEQREEFCSGSNTTGLIGSLGWSIRGTGSTAGAAQGFPYNCGLIIQSTASASTYASIEPTEQNWWYWGNTNSGTAYTATFIFSLRQTTNTRFYVGFEQDNQGIHPANGIWLRYDTNSAYGDTSFHAESCSSSSCTVGGTTYTADTNFHKLVLTSNAAGSVTFAVDANTPQTINTNMPSSAMTPFILCGNDVTATQSGAVANFYALKITGIPR